MTVTLNPELERFIHDQVKAGRFTSVTEALEAGIARLMLDPDPDELDAGDLADIKTSLEQLERGEGVDAETFHAELRAKYLRK